MANEVRGHVTIAAVGDLMLGDMPSTYGFGVGSQIERDGSSFPFIHIIDELKKADIVFGNLETVLSHFDKDNSEFESSVFRGRPEMARGLCLAGFNVLSLANNHIMQHGRAALEETIEALHKNGIGIIGIELLNNHIRNLFLIERNGLRIGFLGYNQRPQQYYLDPPSYVAGSIDVIRRDINLIRDKADSIVVSLHWGEEFMAYPRGEQVKFAHRIIDCGANIILGHHPHVLQGIEKYKGGLIVYSLGNFVFDMWQDRFKRTMILKLGINDTGTVEYEIVPVRINNCHQPMMLVGDKGSALRDYVDVLSRKITVDCDNAEYERVLQRENRRYRVETWLFYLIHFPKYNFRRLLSNLARSIKLRLFNRHKSTTEL